MATSAVFCDGPHRLLIGNTLLLFGSASLLIAQQTYEPPEPESRQTQGTANNDGNSSETATSGIVLGASICVFALLSIIWCAMIMVQVHRFNPPWRRLEELYAQASWDGRNRFMLMAPAVALFVIILLRLFAGAENFEGLPHDLDFGWKYGLLPHDRSVANDGDELYNEPAEKSIAFVVEFNTYAHAVQGLLSALLSFPVIAALLIQKKPTGGGCMVGVLWNLWKNLVLLAPWGFSLYPSYNLLKRFGKAREAFAGSSFGNNGLEWTGGFMFGLAVGALYTSIALWRCIARGIEQDAWRTQTPEDSKSSPWWKFWESSKNKKEQQSQSAATQELVLVERQYPNCCVNIFQVFLGIVFLCTVFAAGVLFGQTWHGCLDGSPDDCVNESEDGNENAGGALQASFVIIPSVVMIGMAILEYLRYR